MLEKMSSQLVLLMQNDDIQAGFELEKKIKEIIKNTASVSDKDGLISLLTKLECYLIPWISSNQFENLLKTNFLGLLVAGIDIKERIKLRLMPYPEDSQEIVKIDFLKAMVKNPENIGQKKIGEWLKEYEKFVDFKKATSLERKNFIEKNNLSETIPKKDLRLLVMVLDLFDYIKPEFDYQKDIENIKIEKKINQPYKLFPSMNKLGSSNKDVLPIQEIIKKYPDLGEQIITSNQIKIKNFNDPIRPSIKNWLSDYTARLGYESHDSIERGNYLFQSENTKNLGYEDRQRLSQILKSFDEKTPLTVDLNTKQVVFSAYAPEKKQETQVIADYPPASPASRFSAADKFPVSGFQTNSKIDIEEGSKPAPAERPTGSTQEIKPENNFHPVYQPKTKEPGDDFEKVIGFGEKKEEDHPISSSPRIINLKEEKKEKPQPATPAPQPKNLLNIKELLEQSRKENTIASPKPSDPNKSNLEIEPEKIMQSPFISPEPNQKPKEAIQNFGMKMGSAQRKAKSLSPENNFVSHSYSQNIKGSPTESFRESLDETEKKLFQTNNQPDQERKGGPIKNDYSVATETSGSNIQFSSPQKLSFEKEREKMEEQETKPAQPEIPQKPQAEPYRIFPSTME